MKTISVLLLLVLAVTLAASMTDQYPKADSNLGKTIEQDLEDIVTTGANLGVAGVNLAAGIVAVCNPATVFSGVTQIISASAAIATNALRLTTDIIDLGHQMLPPNCSTITTNEATEPPTCSLWRDIQGIYASALDLINLGGGLTKAIKDVLHGRFKQAIQDIINIGNTMVQDIERITSYCFDIGHKFLPPGSNVAVQMNLANARSQLQQQIEKVKQADFATVKLGVEDEQRIKQGLSQMEKQFAEAKTKISKK